MPSNADAVERQVVEQIGRKAEHIVWDNRGHVVELDFSCNTVIDSELTAISRLEELEMLNLYYANVNDEQLLKLLGCTKIRSLGLAGTRISDSAVHHLRSLTHLATLDFSNTALTDKCIDDLLEMRQLKYLFVEGTRISNEGRDKIKLGLPNCRIQ